MTLSEIRVRRASGSDVANGRKASPYLRGSRYDQGWGLVPEEAMVLRQRVGSAETLGDGGGGSVKGERLSVIDGLDVNEVKDGLIVYEPDRDRVHYLNGTAAVVFLFCDGTNDA